MLKYDINETFIVGRTLGGWKSFLISFLRRC